MGRRRGRKGRVAYPNLGNSDSASHMQIWIYTVDVSDEHGARMLY